MRLPRRAFPQDLFLNNRQQLAYFGESLIRRSCLIIESDKQRVRPSSSQRGVSEPLFLRNL